MKPKASVVAQKLLNLYRQAHVVIGGWGALNPIFVNEATPEVLASLSELPTGKMLVKHIENLKSGKTPMDSIERDLLPYGGMMAESAIEIDMSESDWNDLVSAISNFTTDQEGLDRIESLPIIKSFGSEWLQKVHSIITKKRPELLPNWETIDKTYNAYMRWNIANDIISNPMTDRSRAQIQAEMLEYETYLPMFGNDGEKLLEKLRTYVSSLKHTPSDNN